MKKMLLLCGALLVVSAAAAFAAVSSDGLHLNFDGCTSDGGTDSKTFACASNSGLNHLVYSMVLSAPMPQYQAVVAETNIATAGVLPAWWGNACTGKTGAQMFAVNGTTGNLSLGCTNDAYAGAGSAGISATRYGWHGTNTLQVEWTAANTAGFEIDLAAGTEYFLGDLSFANTKTVGTGACAGCTTPVCIKFDTAKVDALSLFPVTMIITATDGPWVAWQSPVTSAICLGATPTHNSTWGSVKALYR